MKKIASILAISPRTVEGHIQKLMSKIKCNSQEAVIDFVSRTEDKQRLQQRYFLLNIDSFFQEQLKKISSTISKEIILDILNCHDYNDSDELIKYLNEVGIKVVTNPKDTHKFNTQITFLTNENLFNLSNIIARDKNHKFKKIILLKTDNNIGLTNFLNTDQINIVDYTNHKERYLAVFKILLLLSPTLKLEKVITHFEIFYKNLETPYINIYSKESDKSQISTKNDVTKNFFFVFNTKVLTLSCIFLSLIFLSTLVFYKKSYLKDHNISTVSSNFPILCDDKLLVRPNINNKINKIFKEAIDIKTLVLSGIGGAGKTTIARQYAKNQKANVIWEINAETKATLLSSIEQLANALCQNLEDEQHLAVINEIIDTKIREQKILLFTKKKLKTFSNWLLIYDNVESFKNIQEYFPFNSEIWGKGRILITTRNSNIVSNSYINSNSVVNVESLTDDEKLKLFTSIINKEEKYFSANNNVDEIKKFLKYIPSCPLDVNAAASYIQATRISYDKYLEYITKYDRKFLTLQESILQDTNDYFRTRYSIISLSLQDIINTNPDFKNLLLLISIIDSQNIPRNFLTNLRDEVTVSNFIHELNKISFITTPSSSIRQDFSTFSLHRDIQSIILNYLTNTYDLYSNKKSTLEAVATLKQYMNSELKKYPISIINILIAHNEKLLTHHKLLTDEILGGINTELGRAYLIIGKFDKADFYSKEGLEINRSYFSQNDLSVAESLINLGNVHRQKGEYEKAKKTIEQAYDIYENNYGKHNITTARALLHLASIYKHLGLYQQAEIMFKNVLKVYKAYYGKDHIKIARPLVNIGITYIHLGDYIAAKESLEQGLAVYKKYYGDDHINIAWTLVNLGVVYRNNKQFNESIDLLQQALNIYKKHYGNNHIKVAWNSVNLGDTFKEIKNYAKAEELINNSLIVYKSHYGYEHFKTARVIRDLAAIYLATGKLEKAEKLFYESMAITKKMQHPDEFKCLELLSEIYTQKAKKSTLQNQKLLYESKAQKFLREALELVKKHLGQDSSHFVRISAKLIYN